MSRPSVIVYFADDPSRTYQLVQWLPVLEVLDAVHPVVVVLRDPASAEIVEGRTTLPLRIAPSFTELAELYDELAAKVVLYCNNSMLNFQSLLDARMLHVHLGHGESDKRSMASNNAKAYDRVLVAGEAAVQRHASTLLDFDTDRLVRIGRPQLDLRAAPLLPPSDRRSVLYAPTWESDADYNCYTSLDTIGVRVVQAVLAVPGVRLVYKPHPKVATSERDAVREAHERIVALLDEARAADPDAGHLWLSGDILRILPDCDAMVTDVSSVGLDWLYLCTDKPLFLTDRHRDAARLHDEAPVSRCSDILDEDNVAELGALLVTRLEHDERRLARNALRHHYFDGVQVGESTQRFLRAVGDAVARRDRLVCVDDDPTAVIA